MLLGIDIGGTKTAACLGDGEGKILASLRMPSRPAGELETYFAELEQMCAGLLRGAALSINHVDAIGISAPGPLSVKRGMLLAPPNNPGWVDIPIVERVSRMFNRPVAMNNDANACVLAENFFGSHRGVENMIYLTCSTGMGAGIIAAGRLIQGINDMGGEVGHHTVERNGRDCACGRKGCWEAYVGGRSVGNYLREKILSEKIETRILDLAAGDPEKIGHHTLSAATRANDPFALVEWDDYVERMAQGIGNLIMVLNPEVVFLGTIAVNEGELLLKPLREKLKKYTWHWPREACRVLPSSLGKQIGDLSSLAVAKACVDIRAAS